MSHKARLHLQFLVCGMGGAGTKFGTDSVELLVRKDSVSVRSVSSVRYWNEVVESGAVALLQARQNLKVAFVDAGFTPQHDRTSADDGVVLFHVPDQD